MFIIHFRTYTLIYGFSSLFSLHFQIYFCSIFTQFPTIFLLYFLLYFHSISYSICTPLLFNYHLNHCMHIWCRPTSLVCVWTNCWNLPSYVPLSSSTSTVSVPVGVFSVGDGAGGFLWWQSFNQVQINITSKSTPSSNSSVFVASLRVSGS